MKLDISKHKRIERMVRLHGFKVKVIPVSTVRQTVTRTNTDRKPCFQVQILSIRALAREIFLEELVRADISFTSADNFDDFLSQANVINAPFKLHLLQNSFFNSG